MRGLGPWSPTTTLSEALAVSRRPWLEPHHRRQIARIGASALYVQHTEGSYADAVNEALALARSEVVLKVDDHDTYPEDHASILDHWRPGLLLYGVCEWVRCDGKPLGRNVSLCASAFPSNIRVTPNRMGQITGSVLAQCNAKQVETGVVKYVCPADWSWGPNPYPVACHHGE